MQLKKRKRGTKRDRHNTEEGILQDYSSGKDEWKENSSIEYSYSYIYILFIQYQSSSQQFNTMQKKVHQNPSSASIKLSFCSKCPQSESKQPIGIVCKTISNPSSKHKNETSRYVICNCKSNQSYKLQMVFALPTSLEVKEASWVITNSSLLY